MRTFIALLSLCVAVSAEDFRWQVTDAPFFDWTITVPEGGDLDISGTDVTNSGAGQVSETPALESFVHRIGVKNSIDGGSGSATHIGNGVFLTCRHVFDRSWNWVELDGQRVEAKATVSRGPDFAVVRTDVSSHASAPVSMAPLSADQELSVYGAKTGLHVGVLSPRRWQHGYRAVVCEVPTESGDSGAGVFNAAGELVGVHWGSTGNEVFFTPLSEVQSMFTPGSVAATAQPSSPATEPSTSVCKCLGYRGRQHCFCLQRGVACKCNSRTGSEWNMANGRPVNKTGRYLDPRTPLKTPPLAVSIGEPRPVVTIVSPSSFHCPSCEALKRLDWSGQPFDVRFVNRDGPRLFPQIEWQDKRGTTRILSGYYTPSRVAWSWKATQ